MAIIALLQQAVHPSMKSVGPSSVTAGPASTAVFAFELRKLGAQAIGIGVVVERIRIQAAVDAGDFVFRHLIVVADVLLDTV